MRLLRVLAAASAFAALLTQPLAAQEGRQFKDAWFWGLKGGGLVYSSASADKAVAPMIGADWVITRTKGGLYVSYDESFFSTLGSFTDRSPSNQSFEHFVDLENLRRVNVAGMFFPMQSPTLHPYFGLGVTFTQIASASMQGGTATSSRPAAALDSVQTKRSTFSPLAIGGVQLRMPRFSVFGQATAAPQTDYFLHRGGHSLLFSLEGGIRYNVGSSIDRAR
ncbi:MAG: hypothetical protein JWN79_1849 [Gemmatimonadetes bacterium]|jgi:hypothetical protein|nr:hypothetical protein [Gemmatimonadota bacterium]